MANAKGGLSVAAFAYFMRAHVEKPGPIIVPETTDSTKVKFVGVGGHRKDTEAVASVEGEDRLNCGLKD